MDECTRQKEVKYTDGNRYELVFDVVHKEILVKKIEIYGINESITK